MFNIAEKKIGKDTIVFKTPVNIQSMASIVGPKEGKSNLAGWFDVVVDDDMFGEMTPEKAERRFQTEAVNLAMDKLSLEYDSVDYFLAGDLLNQIITSSITASIIQVPFIGLYGACSTSALSLGMGCCMVDGGFAERVVCATSSHYQCAERQFRYPIELNVQRKLTSQYTVTGSGAAVIGKKEGFAKVTHFTVGRAIDMGIKDANIMGPAMAPAAADTLARHLNDTNRRPEDYDYIVTGDLGSVGGDIFKELSKRNGYALDDKKYIDCGTFIFKGDKTVGSGGSGCGCSGSVLCSYFAKRFEMKEISRILLIATGALFSPISALQSGTISGIGNAVAIESVV